MLLLAELGYGLGRDDCRPLLTGQTPDWPDILAGAGAHRGRAERAICWSIAAPCARSARARLVDRLKRAVA